MARCNLLAANQFRSDAAQYAGGRRIGQPLFNLQGAGASGRIAFAAKQAREGSGRARWLHDQRLVGSHLRVGLGNRHLVQRRPEKITRRIGAAPKNKQDDGERPAKGQTRGSDNSNRGHHPDSLTGSDGRHWNQ